MKPYQRNIYKQLRRETPTVTDPAPVQEPVQVPYNVPQSTFNHMRDMISRVAGRLKD